MAKNWNAAVIGCGAIAQALHLPGYVKTRGVTLVAAADPTEARWPEVRRFKSDVRMYKDHRDMFKAEQLDMVSVSSPNRFHCEHAVAALEHGAHVMLEKPAALSMKEMSRMKAAMKKSGRLLCVGYSHRFHSGNLKMKKILDAGTIGEPFMFRIRFAHMGPLPGWAKDPWFYNPALAGGGALLDMGIHAIDQALWLIGPVKSVQAYTATLRKDIKLDDNAIILLEFANGRALGYIEVGWSSPSGFTGIEVMGDKGSIHDDYRGAMTLSTMKISPDMTNVPKYVPKVVDEHPIAGGWGIEIPEVYKAFRRGSDRGHGIEAGGAALAVALAAYESAKTGKRIKVNYKF